MWKWSFLIFFLSLKCLSGSWTREALRLSGGSDQTRRQALGQLRQQPHLHELLLKELAGPQRGLALDVISALEMRSFLPTLLEKAQTDESGFIYLTINTLLTMQNRDEVVAIYRQRLFCPPACKTSPAAQVILLDALSFIHEKLPYNDLRLLLLSPGAWPEVKAAVVAYVREQTLEQNDNRYLPLLKIALADPSLQLREQTIYFIAELPKDMRRKRVVDLQNCALPVSPTTQNLCRRLAQEK